MSTESEGQAQCLFAIDGMPSLLAGQPGLFYCPNDGLNVVISGPAGAGKTLLALQMAVSGSVENAKNVLFLTKDTPPDSILHHLLNDFHLFGKVDGAVDRHLSLPRPREHFEVLLGAPKKTNPRQYARWLRKHTRDFSSLSVKLRGNPACQRPARIQLVLLDRIIDAISAAVLPEEDVSEIFADILNAEVPVLCFSRFDLAGVPEKGFERDIWSGALFAGIGRLCPGLRPLFTWLAPSAPGAKRHTHAPNRAWRACPLVVLDSVPSELLEDCLRIQSQRLPGGPHEGPLEERPIALFVSEMTHLPEAMNTLYPPDVHIQLDAKEGPHGSKKRTIQFLKARFQKIQQEPSPLTITDASSKRVSECCTLNAIQSTAASAHDEMRRLVLADPNEFEDRVPGISILPSLVSVDALADQGPQRRLLDVSFGVEELDNMTQEGTLAGGGCSLLVTENRCHSTALGLHYLLGAAGQKRTQPRGHSEQGCVVPRSVLYIALDEDLPGVLHDIWRYPVLRSAIWNGSPEKAEAAWHDVAARARTEVSMATERSKGKGLQRLYRVPLRHFACQDQTKAIGAYLYVLIPDLVWCCQEEILDCLRRLLKYANHEFWPNPRSPCKGARGCLTIDRILLNRVSRIESRWPLVQDANVFVSALVQMCRAHLADLMVVDDTAFQSPSSGHISSHWISAAQNVLRLKRLPFRDREAIAFELVRSHGRRPRFLRPQELVSREVVTDGLRGGMNRSLGLEDSFRGYTVLFSGKPERCRVEVDLTYDREGSAWHRDAMSMKQNLETLMEGTKVNLMGPEQRPGVNSALSNLAFVAHNTCHIVSVDEVWLHRVIGEQGRPSGLSELSAVDLGHVLQSAGETPHFCQIKDKYVTEAMTIATKKANRPETIYAVPFRNNWGILAISQPRAEHIRDLFGAIAQHMEQPHDAAQLPAGAAVDRALQHWGGDCAKTLFAVLTNDVKQIREVSRRLRTVGERVRRLIWDVPPASGEATWQDLVHFKTMVWDRVAQSDGVRHLLDVWGRGLHVSLDTEDEAVYAAMRQWFGPRTEIEFFGFDRGVTESVVSFLLELLLTGADWDDCFDHDFSQKQGYQTASLLYLSSGPKMKKHLTRVLMLIYHLLSARQRREIGIEPVRSGRAHRAQPDSESAIRENVDTGQPGSTVSLFSREWFSTVPTIAHPHCDLRNRIILKPLLPFVGDTEGRHLFHSITRSRKRTAFSKGLLRACKGKGVSISGTWYLGALSGGNRELATDVIRELVSEYHERDRIIAGGCAPVTRPLCRLAAKDAVHSRMLPYADVVSYVCDKREHSGTPEEDKHPENVPTFPFCRTRIREYTSISLELADMVRQVMTLDEEHLRTDFRAEVGRVVAATLARIEKINGSRRRLTQAPLA